MTAATQAPPADAAGLDLAVDALRSTATVRARARAMLARARAGDSAFFAVHDAALAPTAELVAEVTRQRYPTLAVPYHSRWRHFEAGGVDRRALLDERLGDVSPAVRARARIDLALVQVSAGYGFAGLERYDGVERRLGDGAFGSLQLAFPLGG